MDNSTQSKTKISELPAKWAENWSYGWMALGIAASVGMLVLFSVMAADKETRETFGETIAIIGAVLAGLCAVFFSVLVYMRYQSSSGRTTKNSVYDSRGGMYDGLSGGQYNFSASSTFDI